MIIRMLFFSFEDVKYAVQALKCNKTAGPDLLGAKHLQCAGDRLPVLLTKLFKFLFSAWLCS